MDKLRPYLLLLALSFLVYLPVMTHASSEFVDFGNHIKKALALPHLERPFGHVLFHAVFLSVHRLAPHIPNASAALVAILLLMLPVPLLAFAALRRAAGDALPAAVLMSLALALAIVAPITIWADKFMLGYLNPIVYHNPTSIAARLFVIPLSLLALRIFQPGADHSLNQRVYIALLSATVLLLATLAKPSFTVVLLPGCCLFALWRQFRRQRVDWRLFVCGFCLPAALLMGLFYLLSYESQSQGSAIAVGFMTFMQHWIPAWRIPIQLVLSLAFPLAALALYFEQARRHLYLNMCWIVFAASAVTTYLLYEDGRRFSHGNLIWSGYSAAFLLMFASMLFVVEQHRRECKLGHGDLLAFGIPVSRKAAIAFCVFGLHLLSGLVYYYRFTTQFTSL